jgi:hypothetical protein
MGLMIVNKRWRIRDNMPGTRAFCPMVVKSRAGAAALGLDVRALIHALQAEFGTDLLMRSAVRDVWIGEEGSTYMPLRTQVLRLGLGTGQRRPWAWGAGRRAGQGQRPGVQPRTGTPAGRSGRGTLGWLVCCVTSLSNIVGGSCAAQG